MKNRAGLPDNFDPNKVYFVKGDLLSRLCALVGGLNSDDGTVDVEYGADQIVARVAKRTAVGSPFAHPWKVAVTGSGATLAYTCTNGIDGASYAGCVWTREGDRLTVDKVGPTAIAASKTICCKVTIPDAGGTPSAEIVEISGAVNYWQHAASEGVVKHFPLAIVTVAAGVATVEQLRFSDIDAGAGTNVNDDATSLLTDGTTEFLVLTQQGAAGATAAAKLRKLTVQIDHGRIIRWEWGTPETGIGYSNDSLTKYEKVKWDGTAHKLVQETWTERWENGVLLERTQGSDVDIVSFTEYVPCSGS